MRRRGTTMLRRTMRTVRRMRAWHVDTMRTRIPWLWRIAEVRLVMFKTDHVRVRRVSSVRVLIILRHQWNWHVTHCAWIWLHVWYLANNLRHVCHLWRFQQFIERTKPPRMLEMLGTLRIIRILGMVRISRILRMFDIIGLNILKMLSIIKLWFLKMLKVPEMSIIICKGTDFEHVRIPKKTRELKFWKVK